MEPVKFGIVGVGGMGAAHVKSMAEIAEVELVAVADVNSEAAAKTAQETGARAFTDYKDLIRKGGIEAVIIATPPLLSSPRRSICRRAWRSRAQREADRRYRGRRR